MKSKNCVQIGTREVGRKAILQSATLKINDIEYFRHPSKDFEVQSSYGFLAGRVFLGVTFS